MSVPIQIVFLITFFFALSGKANTIPVLDGDDFEIVIDPEDYGAEDDQGYLSPYLVKRSGFWYSHPSDFSPMRRPGSSSGQSPRSGSKKSESSPYHPIPRTIYQSQKSQRSLPMSSSQDELDAMLQGLRDKRQSPGSFLLMKLGRMNNKSAGDVNRRLGRRGRA